MTAPPLPQLPSRYLLWPTDQEALLGRGGAAEVWRVQDQDLGVLVALKVLRSTGAGVRSRLEREAVLAARVVHPHVIALHDVGRTPDDKSYIAFALASGGSMLDISRHPPQWPVLRELMIQLLEALAALHARGILHLDVKLSNLLLHRTGHNRKVLWLADLGVSRALWGEEEDDARVIGTVSYMAPERLTGRHHLWCPATDIFAVGAVMYRLLCGQLPFPARNPTEALKQRMHPPRTLKVRGGYRVPPGLDEVILPMLQADHRSRYDLAADAIRALRNLPETEGTVGDLAYPRNPAGQIWKRGLGAPVWYCPPVSDPRPDLARPRAPRRVPQAPSLLVHREIPLIGRSEEFERLARAARTVLQESRPLLVEINGPKGVGRTRLVEEFTRAIEESGLGEGVRLDYGGAGGPTRGLRGAWRRLAPAGGTMEQYVRDLGKTLARDRQARPADCTMDARALAAWLRPSDGHVPSNRAVARDLMTEHLSRRSWRGLSWLWIEDADNASENDECWDIIDLVLASEAPILVLVSRRSDRLSPALLELRARHTRAVRSLQLYPLNTSDSTDLVHAHLPLDPELASRLSEHSAGTPQSIHGLLAWWVRSGRLREVNDPGASQRVWTLADGGATLPHDRETFARQRLAGLQDHPDLVDALRAIALAGKGTPLTVLERVIGPLIDRLVVEGVLHMDRGTPALVPGELADVIIQQSSDPVAIADIQGRLAKAWAAEGDDPAVLERVGVHYSAAGNHRAALGPLYRALRARHRSISVPVICELASRVLRAGEATGQRDSPPWVYAAHSLAAARWRSGDRAGSRRIDARLAHTALVPEAVLRVACAQVSRGLVRDPTHVLNKVSNVALTRVSTPARAILHITRAHVFARALDVESALAELYDALSSRPEPETECRARLLRARLLIGVDPMAAWHEVMRTVSMAIDHGMLRYEVLAWGLATDAMIRLDRAEEVIERLRAGVARLDAHGEHLAAMEARLHFARALRDVGRLPLARRTLEEAIDAGPPAYDTAPFGAGPALGLLAVLERDSAPLAKLPRPARPTPAESCAWAIIDPLGRLLQGARPGTLPGAEVVRQAVSLGVDGLFLAQALTRALHETRHIEAARACLSALREGCHRLGHQAHSASRLIDRFEAGAS